MAPSHSGPSDAELIREVLRGSPARFDGLIDRHFGLVYAIALARLRDADLAEDLAQEVFLRAYLHLRALQDPSQFAAWVARVARNLAVDWLRRGQRASRVLPMVPLEAIAHDGADPEAKGARETMAEEQESHALRKAMDSLSPELREVVLLHYSEDLSQHEIAERLGMNQSTVSRHLKRALQALRGVLEPALRREVKVMRPSRQVMARASIIVAGVAALSESAQAALAAAGPMAPLAALGGGKSAASAAGAAGLLKILTTAIVTGGKAMGTAKGLFATGAVVAAVAGGVYLTQTDSSSEGQPARTVSTQSVSAGDVSTVDLNPMFALVPQNTALLAAAPHMRLAVERAGSFLIEAGAPPEYVGTDVDVLDPAIDANGAIVWASPPNVTQWGLLQVSLDDLEGFIASRRRHVNPANGITEHTNPGGIHWVESPTLVIAAHGSTAVRIMGEGAEQRIQRLFDPHPVSPLVGLMEDIPVGGARAVIDMAQIAAGPFGDRAGAFLDEVDSWPANMPSQAGISFRGTYLWLFRQEARDLLDLARRMEPLVATAMPSRERVDLDLSLRLQGAEDSQANPPRNLHLASWIPNDAILVIDSGLGGRRGHLFIDAVQRYLGRILLGGDPAANEAVKSMANTLCTLIFYNFSQAVDDEPVSGLEWTNQEIALAICPPAGHALNPGRVLLMKPLEGDFENLIEDLRYNWITGAEFTSTSEMIRREYVGSADVAGHEVHHFRMTGEALNVHRSMDNIADMRQSPFQAMLGSVGDVDHWFSHRDGVVILTTEPEPTLMGRILRGDELGVHEPFASDERDADSPEGDIAIRLSLGRFFEWATAFATQGNGGDREIQMFSGLSRHLLGIEQGIWLRVDTLPGGFDAHLIVPASDASVVMELQTREVESRRGMEEARAELRSEAARMNRDSAGDTHRAVEGVVRFSVDLNNVPLGEAIRRIVPPGTPVFFEVSNQELNQILVVASFTDMELDRGLTSLLRDHGLGFRRSPDGSIIIMHSQN